MPGVMQNLRVRLALPAALLVAVSSAGAAGAHRPPPTGNPFAGDTMHECLEPVPESVGVRGFTDHGEGVFLEVLVLLDGISRQRAAEVVATASEPYDRLGIVLRPSYRKVRFDNSGEYHEMEASALKAVGGRRPRGFDVVYVMTAKDIHSMGDYSVAGFAFCVGGVRDPEVAFAVGEGSSPYEESLRDELFSGKIMAHELGHLLGAHHHYGNCVEGGRSTEGGGEPSLCTLMWTVNVAYVGLEFGSLETAVIRGHAVDYASS